MAVVVSARYDAIVIGAGVAGLSAAVRLSGRGARVLVVEARARLGGRATAFADRETGELVDNGQHVLFGCYTETFDFLRAIGALDNVRLQPQLAVTMIDRRGRASRLVCPPLPAPFHLVAGLLDWEALSWSDRLAALRMLAPLRLARRQLAGGTAIAASPGETVEGWLVRNGQTPATREMLWNPLALAALNQQPAEAAAPPFARVLAEMFGADARAAALALPIAPLHLMYAEPARAYVEQQGGTVRLNTAARIRVRDGAVESVEAGGERWTAAAVVSAVPWFALGELFEYGRAEPATGPARPRVDTGPPALARILDRARRMASSPIITVNLWFDRQILGEPFVGLPGRSMQWVFDKRAMWGEQAAHLSLVAGGASPIVNRTNQELLALAHTELVEAFPASRSARLLRGTVVREPRATFSLAPGQPERPATVTPVARLFLAGDWIETGLPATIESAVRSGHRAAEAATLNW